MTTTNAAPRTHPADTSLPDIGDSILTAAGEPRFGVYRGIPPTFDYERLSGNFARNRVTSFLRHKKWVYFFVATDDVIVVSALVDAGPTGTGFLMVTDRATGEVLADVSRPGGAGPMVSVGANPSAGHRAHYLMPGSLMTLRGDDLELRLRTTFHKLPYVPLYSEPWIDLDVRLATDIHPGVTTVAEIEGKSLATATSKNAGLPTMGSLTIHRDGHTDEFDLSGGFGGFDYTNGFLPRHTSWRWAFTTGALDDGRVLGLNLVSGFSGLGGRARENALWLDSEVVPLDPEARIEFDESDALAPWRVTTIDNSVDLTFTPLALHREGLNLGVIRSKFIQPTGHFSGTVTCNGETITIDALPGVVEDQDVLW